MTPTECKELLAEVKNALRDELDSNDFSFDLGFNEQSFPERDRELVLENNLTAEVSFRAEGYRKIDRGDHYIPPCESGKITVGITRVVVWNEDGDEIYEYKALYPYHETNSFTIKY